jgi:hypothetical protein
VAKADFRPCRSGFRRSIANFRAARNFRRSKNFGWSVRVRTHTR